MRNRARTRLGPVPSPARPWRSACKPRRRISGC